MDSFMEKFNIFDLFTMLIPGIIISTLFSTSLSFQYYNLWKTFGNEKYALFFIIIDYFIYFHFKCYPLLLGFPSTKSLSNPQLPSSYYEGASPTPATALPPKTSYNGASSLHRTKGLSSLDD